MKNVIIPVLLLAALLSSCVVTSTGSTYSGSNGSSEILKYSHYRGSAFSAAKASFTPSSEAVVEVYCQNTDFMLRRSLEEAIAAAFEAKGIKCVMFSDYSAGLMLSDLTDGERDNIGWKEFLDGVEYYINISMGDYSTYTYGGGIAKCEFSFNINTYEQVLSGSLYIEEANGNNFQESYLQSLKKVLKLAGDLIAQEYVKYCPDYVKATASGPAEGSGFDEY